MGWDGMGWGEEDDYWATGGEDEVEENAWERWRSSGIFVISRAEL